MRNQPQLRSPISSYGNLILMGMGVCLCWNSLIHLSRLIVSFPSYQQDLGDLYQLSLGKQLIISGVIYPVWEELLFRKLIFGSLRGRMGFLGSCLISAFLFGCYHGNLMQAVYGFTAGCLLAIVYEQYGVLTAPLLLHGSINSFSLLFMAMGLNIAQFRWFLLGAILLMITGWRIKYLRVIK